MSSSTDPLSPPPAPIRVYYSLGRMLGVNDFQADQDYHRACLARALLQLCGTGTVFGLKVNVTGIWQPTTNYPASGFVFDQDQNVQVNTGVAGTSGAKAPAFATAPGGVVTDANGIVWTNEGQINANGWRPNAPFPVPSAIIDSNNNIQILNGTSVFTAGRASPVWSTAIGSTTQDGVPAVPAWTCVGPSTQEIEVTAGLAIDRVGRLIEVPSTVCIRMQPWLANQAASDLNNAIFSGKIWVDVIATFAACTRGVTPCFATQDDYDATDAFSANRLLDSFAMQLVLRTDASAVPSGRSLPVPKDPWLPVGAVPAGGIAGVLASIQQSILQANSGPAANSPFTAGGTVPAETPAGVDPSSVLLARISIPATQGAGGQPPAYNLSGIQIDNTLRLFVYPPSLVARSLGFTSGAES